MRLGVFVSSHCCLFKSQNKTRENIIWVAEILDKNLFKKNIWAEGYLSLTSAHFPTHAQPSPKKIKLKKILLTKS